MTEAFRYEYRSLDEEIERLEASLVEMAREPLASIDSVDSRHEENRVELYKALSNDDHYCGVGPNRRRQIAEEKYSRSVAYATTRVALESALKSANSGQAVHAVVGRGRISNYTRERLQDVLQGSWRGFDNRLQNGKRTDDYRAIITALMPDDDPLGKHLLEVTQVAETVDPRRPLSSEVTKSIRRSYDNLMSSPAGRYGEAGLRRHALVTQSILNRYAQHRDPVKQQGGEPYHQIVTAMDCHVVEKVTKATVKPDEVAKTEALIAAEPAVRIDVKLIDDVPVDRPTEPKDGGSNVRSLQLKTFGEELKRRRASVVAAASVALGGTIAATLFNAAPAAAAPVKNNDYLPARPAAIMQPIVMVPSIENGSITISPPATNEASNTPLASAPVSGESNIVMVPNAPETGATTVVPNAKEPAGPRTATELPNAATPKGPSSAKAISSPTPETAIVAVPEIIVKSDASGDTSISTSNAVQQSAQSQNVLFSFKNGNSQDALDAMASSLESQGYVKAPNNAYSDLVKRIVEKYDEESKGQPNPAGVLALEGVEYPGTAPLIHDQLQSYIGSNAAFNAGAVKYYFNAPDGQLVGAHGEQDYGPVTLSDTPVLLASALGNLLSPVQQKEWLSEVAPEAATAEPPATPKPVTTTPAPAPKPADNNEKPKSDMSVQNYTFKNEAAHKMYEKGKDWHNKAIAFDFFLNNGFAPYEAAAIVGNLEAESSVNPHRVQVGFGPNSNELPHALFDVGGYGIAQWTSKGRQLNLIAYAKKHNGSTGDLMIQLKFLLHEARSGYADVIAQMHAVDSHDKHAAQKAASIWMGHNDQHQRGFENPNPQYAHEDVRRDNAHAIYSAFIDNQVRHEAKTTNKKNPAGLWLAHRALSFVHNGPFQERGVLPLNKYTTPEFRNAIEHYVGGTGMTTDDTDCGAAVRTFVGELDPNYKDLGTWKQREYVRNSPLWQTFENPKPGFKLQPGDIFVNRFHTYMYVGRQSNGKSVVEASQYNHGPHLDATPYYTHDGEAFTIARYVGNFDASKLNK